MIFSSNRIVLLFALLFAISANAYDYPAIGGGKGYENIFKTIESGECGELSDPLKELYDEEGISGNIYMAICLLDSGSYDKGFDTLDLMIEQQEYDEVLYIVNSMESKNIQDVRLLKYKGLAYFNIGAFKIALDNLKKYTQESGDADVVYSIIDIYITLRQFDKAEVELKNITVRDGRYYFRRGRINLKKGNINSAYFDLRMVRKSDVEVYSGAKMLLAELCLSSGRFSCVEKELKAASEGEYKDIAEDKLKRLDERKKKFSAFVSFSEQYDTNVTSVDEDEVNGVSEQKSFRTAIAADLKLNFYPSYADKVSVGMLNYKTWNHSLSSYNTSVHKIHGAMFRSYDNFDVVFPSASLSLTYFDGEKYQLSGTIEGSVTYKRDRLRIKVPLKVSLRDYYADTSSGSNDRDGYVYTTGLKVTGFLSRKLIVSGEGEYVIDEAEGELKQKREATFKASASYRLSRKLNMTGSYEYGKYDYNNWFRKDEFQSFGLKGTYRFSNNIFFNGGATFSKMNSEENVYDYEKSVFETSVNYSF